ncbi:MAG: alpha/beta fold hydrolase [Flavobacteriaceae bacterium]
MKKLFTLFLFTTLTSFVLSAQSEITGQWSGTLEVQGIELRVVFNVSQIENGYKTTMDSPDQGAKDIPIPVTVFNNPNVKFEIPGAIEYTGALKGDKIIGTFKQSGVSLALDLTKNTSGEDLIKRPQEPKEPFSYYSEDVIFRNKKANITLAGTLTLPNQTGKFPAVVLISGSGAQDRNSEILGHKPFLVWSDYLTKNGIAVLRFDERGVGESEGNFAKATSNDFATDVQSAVEFLKTRKEIHKKKIGLIGHSEGGVIAPMVAVSNPKDISFIVLLAGAGIQGSELLLLQQKLILAASGIPQEDIEQNFEKHSRIFQEINQSTDDQQLKTNLNSIVLEYTSDNETPQGMTKEQYAQTQTSTYTSPWMLNFIRYNPAVALQKVKCAVLAINGDKDLQVPATENLTAIRKALNKGKNKKITTKQYPNLNHLFQESETGLPQEYSLIEQTIFPKVLEDVTHWIKIQTK